MGTGLTGKRNNEILSNVHDPNIGALRTTLTGATVGITTTQAPAGDTVLFFGQALSLAIGASYNVIQYDAITANTKYVQKIYFSGTQVGTAIVYKNGSELLKVRLSPTIFTQIIDLATGSAFGLKLELGDSVVIEAINNSTNVGDFDVSLQIMEAGL